MPAAGECAPDAWPDARPPDARALPGERTWPSERGCTWARRQTAHLVHGHELTAAGLDVTPMKLRDSQPSEAELVRARDVIQGVFAKHPTRCCDC